jgi:hypothetical protein
MNVGQMNRTLFVAIRLQERPTLMYEKNERQKQRREEKKKEIESNRKDKQVRLYVALDENTRCQCGSTYLSYI